MKLLKKNNAFTLIELMFVIAIISIMTSIISPHFIKSLEDASQVTDEANLKILNSATCYCKFIEEKEYYKKFKTSNSDNARMDFLLSQGYVDNIPTIMNKNMKFHWDEDIEKWLVVSREKGERGFYYVFSNQDLEKIQAQGKWVFPVEAKEYNVNVLLKLEGKEAAVGLLIDYSREDILDDSSDETMLYQGYSVQLEKNNGQGALVLREIKGKKSGSILPAYKFNHLNSFFIPDKRTITGEKWWNSFHSLSFSIKDERQLEVYLDYQLVFDDIYLPGLAEDRKVYTGIYLEEGNLQLKEIEIN